MTNRLTPVQWLICAIAAIGFAFDIYEILMLPLVVRPALLQLSGAAPGSPQFQMWVGRLFYIPAFAGGIFGLIGGYLTDRFGRRRVLTYSILIYALAAFASGFSTSVEMLLILRCFVFIGVCVEFVAATAWLAELFTEPARREKVLGYTQAFSSIGGVLVATVNGLCVTYAHNLPAIGGFGLTIADPHGRRTENAYPHRRKCVTCYSPERPSIDSRRRSAWPLCRAYSSIRCTSSSRTAMASFPTRTLRSG